MDTVTLQRQWVAELDTLIEVLRTAKVCIVNGELGLASDLLRANGLTVAMLGQAVADFRP